MDSPWESSPRLGGGARSPLARIPRALPWAFCFGPFGAAEKRNTKIRKGGRGFRRRFAQQFQDEWKPRATPTFHHPTVLLLSCSHRASRPVVSREQWSS